MPAAGCRVWVLGLCQGKGTWKVPGQWLVPKNRKAQPGCLSFGSLRRLYMGPLLRLIYLNDRSEVPLPSEANRACDRPWRQPQKWTQTFHY